MKNKYSTDSFLISAVVAASSLLGFMIGFLINPDLVLGEKKNPGIERENKNLKSLLSNSKQKNKELENEIEKLKGSVKKPASSPSAKKTSNTTFNAAAARKAFNKRVVENDFKIIDGIGPKVESIIKNRNIKTWLDLSKAKADDIRKFLVEDGGERYHIHVPTTWPKQAKMATEGKWEELVKFQGTLSKGKQG